MEEASSILYHIYALNKIILDLRDINVKIDDKDKAMIFLCSLPSSYEHLLDTLMYDRQTLTIAYVKHTRVRNKTNHKEICERNRGLRACSVSF